MGWDQSSSYHTVQIFKRIEEKRGKINFKLIIYIFFFYIKIKIYKFITNSNHMLFSFLFKNMYKFFIFLLN